MGPWLLLCLTSADARTPGAGPMGERLLDHVELFPAETRLGVLPTGMRLVVVTRHDAPRVSVATFFPGGSGDDPAGREGAAHLAEHVWFRSGAGGSPVRERLQQLGADWQGTTERDGTLFATVAPARSLDGLLALEDIRVRAGIAGATEAQIEAERSVVAREQELRGPVAETLFGWLYAALFPDGHPLHRRTIEAAESLARVTLADVHAAAATWHPAGATLLLAGDLPPAEDLDALLRRVAPTLVGDGTGPLALGPWPAPPPAGLVPHPQTTALGEILAEVDEPTVAFAWALPGSGGADPVSLDVTTALAAKLLQDAVDQVTGSTRQARASCHLDVEEPASTIVCTVAIGGRSFGDVFADGVMGAFDALLFGDINAGADWRRKTATSVSQVGAMLREEGLAQGELNWVIEAAEQYHRFGPAASLRARAERLDGIQTAEVIALARRWLVRDHLVSVVLVPDPHRDVAVGAALAAGDPGPPSPPGQEYAPLPPRDVPALREETLPGGLHVMIAAIPGFPTVWGTMSFRAGTSPERSPALDRLLWAAASPFWDDEDGVLRNAALEAMGRWSFDRSSGGHRYGFMAPANRADVVLGALGRLVSSTRLDFDLDYHEEWRALRRVDRRRVVAVAANDDVNAVLLQGHPLAQRPEVGGIPPVSPGSPAAVRRAFAGVYRPENAALVIVGAVDVEGTLAAVRAGLGSWRGDPSAPPSTPAAVVKAPAPPGRTLLLYAEDRPTTMVDVECLLSSAPASEAEREVTAALVREAVWRRLREGRGITYAPDAHAWTSTGGLASLVVRAPVGPGSAAVAVREILDLLASLSTGPVGAPDLDRARYRTALARWARLSTGPGLSAALLEAWEDGRPSSDVAADPSRVEEAGVHAQLAPCAGHEVVSVIGAKLDIDAVATQWPDARRVSR